MKKMILLICTAICFTSCFHAFIEPDITAEWNSEKLEKLCREKQYVLVCFTDDIRILYKPEKISGMESLQQNLTLTSLSKKNTGLYLQTIKGNEKMGSEVQIFINEKYLGQDSIVITRDNFLQIWEYKVGRELSFFGYLFSGAVTLAIIILVIATILYTNFLSRSINSYF